MPTLTNDPTPIPDVNEVLHYLLSAAQNVLGDHFVGLYLYGSLASGDFDQHRSDIDFLVVTRAVLPDTKITELEAMHALIAVSGLKWATKLEGAYLPQSVMPRYRPTDIAYPTINEGKFFLARQGPDGAIQRHILREQGVVVTGPALQPLIDPVQPHELQDAVRGILREWWLPMIIAAPSIRLQSSEYQVYAILTMCRALYTLQHGTIASKPVSARWAQARLDERWEAIIEWALTWQADSSVDHLNETLDLIHYTLDAFNFSTKDKRSTQ